MEGTEMNIKAINQELAKIGYKAVKLPRRKGEWVPKTAAGVKCKARMAFWARMPKVDWSPRKPCVDMILRRLGIKAASSHDMGGFSPTRLWIASVAPRAASNRMIESV
jgi:hypothetical protein